MSLQKIFCSECGTELEVDGDKGFCFCLECGNKIILNTKESERGADENNASESSAQTNDEVDRKLEEVNFYYNLSMEKKEYEKIDADPTYYLKAQDILIDLSEKYPEDYRIWWELCKPVDFMNASSGTDIHNQYKINENYFGKALDYAELSKKRFLIEKHDEYVKNKEAVKEITQKRLQEEEERRQKQEREEQQKLEKEQEEQRRKEEEAERIRQEEEEKRMKAEFEMSLELSTELWANLAKKDYTAIDNTYFTIPQGNNQTIIGVFKLMSNMLYFSSFRIDGNKSNTVYSEQTMAVQFDDNGCVIKFDKKPIRIKGVMPPDNVLKIIVSTADGLLINNMQLVQDGEYVTSILKFAKKSMFSSLKIFI